MQHNSIKYIDRDEAVEAIQKKAKRIKNLDTINGLCGAISILYELPVNHVKGKEGQWIRTDKRIKDNLYVWKVTCCGREFIADADLKSRDNYCLNCGAKIESEE